MKAKTMIITASAVVAAGVTVYLLYRRGKKADEAAAAEAASSDKAADETTCSFPLKNGMQGAEIKQLQKALNVFLVDAAECGDELPTYNKKSIKALQEDGIWGGRTEAAVKWHFGKNSVTKSDFDALLEAVA